MQAKSITESHALTKPGKIPLTNFLSAPPVVSVFLFMAVN